MKRFFESASAALLAVCFSFVPLKQASADNQNPIGGNIFFGRNDTTKYINAKYPHGGPGTVRYMELTPRDQFKTQFMYVHRGIIDPKSGLGEHVHRWMEEMYFILDKSVARFAVNGHVAELPGPAMAICPMGGSHGIYNPTDKPIELMNIGIALEDHKYDAVDYAKQDDLVNAPVESPPPFMWSVLDRRLMKEIPCLYGGKGKMLYRTVWTEDRFRTNCLFVNHYILPAGSSIGYHKHDDMEEVYYIFSGAGRMTIDGVTMDVKAGDAASVVLHGSHGLFNNSKGDLEVISIAVCDGKKSRDVPRGTALNDDLTGK